MSRPRQIAPPDTTPTEITIDRHYDGDWGSGCSTSSGSAPTALALLLALLAVRCRRRRRE